MSKSKHIRPKGIFRTFFNYLHAKGESHLEEIFLKKINGRPQNENTLTSIFKEMGMSEEQSKHCLLYTSPSPRDYAASRMPSSA